MMGAMMTTTDDDIQKNTIKNVREKWSISDLPHKLVQKDLQTYFLRLVVHHIEFCLSH